MLTGFILILKELLPFLKEALLEGQTFRVWIKSNWHTFLSLISLLILTLGIAHLTESLILSNQQHQQAQDIVNGLQAPLNALVKRQRELLNENTELKQAIQELEVAKNNQADTLTQYETWLSACGVNLETGRCKVAVWAIPKKIPAHKKHSTSNTAKTPTDRKTPIQSEVEQTPGLFQKLRNMLRRVDGEK
jgi:hypothetical protein